MKAIIANGMNLLEELIFDTRMLCDNFPKSLQGICGKISLGHDIRDMFGFPYQYPVFSFCHSINLVPGQLCLERFPNHFQVVVIEFIADVFTDFTGRLVVALGDKIRSERKADDQVKSHQKR
jgi:hypothetical protein